MKNLISARIDDITPLTNTVLQISLHPDKYIDYQAGQYLQIESNGEFLSYSIANAPLGSHKYELHIRHCIENQANQVLLNQIRELGKVKLQLPFGNCKLKNIPTKAALIFIAGGIGFAPIKAMIEQLLADGDTRNFHLFWFARTESDLYMGTMLENWQKNVLNFSYHPFITGNINVDVIDILKNIDLMELSAAQYVISGGFDMVYSLRDNLVSQGIPKKNIFSDAFDFEIKKE